ncbi:MAG: tyrosine-type recombinase/integrase [Methanobacteriota archaeon]
MDSITKFLEQKQASGLSKNTIKSYRIILTALNKFKNIDEITKDDLVKFFNKPFNSESTKFLYVVSVKNYFKETGRPELTNWLKAKRPKETLNSADILTSDDVQAMIDVTDSFYWKSLLAILYETGARINEIQVLKWKDLIMSEYTTKENGTEKKINAYLVHLKTAKTAAGFRKLVLPYSTSYLQNLYEMTDHNPESKIFKLCYKHHFDVIGELGRRAKIGKHVHPHAMRHARATSEIQKGTPEPILRKMLGWSPNSTIPSRYIHLSDTDVIDNQLGMNHYEKNGNIKIAEKVDVHTAFDEVKAVREENAALKTKMESFEKMMEDMIEKRIEARVLELKES